MTFFIINHLQVDYKRPLWRIGKTNLKKKNRLVSNFLSPQTARWETETESRLNNRPILLARVMLAPSPDLMLLTSPLHPTALSTWGKASPASLLSQLRAPAGMHSLKVWHLLWYLAGLQIILHHDQWKYFGAKEPARKVHATPDPETISNALVELVRCWSFLWPQLTLGITAVHPQELLDRIRLKVWALK